MSISSLETILDALGGSFVELSSVIQGIKDGVITATSSATDLPARLTTATASISPGMVSDPLGTGPLYSDIADNIADIGLTIQTYASLISVQTDVMVENLQTSLIAGQANASLDESLGGPPVLPSAKFATATGQATAIQTAIKTTNTSIMTAVTVAETAIAAALLANRPKNVFGILDTAVTAVQAATVTGKTGVSNNVAGMGSTAAAAVRSAFQKGMKLALPSMGPNYVPPSD